MKLGPRWSQYPQTGCHRRVETKAASSGRGSPRSSTLREQEVTGQTLIIIAEAWCVVLIGTLILSSWSQSPCDDEPLHGPRASCTCLKTHNKDKGKQAWTVQGTKVGSASSTLATWTCSLKTRPKNSNQATMGIRCRLPGPSSSTPARSFASKGFCQFERHVLCGKATPQPSGFTLRTELRSHTTEHKAPNNLPAIGCCSWRRCRGQLQSRSSGPPRFP